MPEILKNRLLAVGSNLALEGNRNSLNAAGRLNDLLVDTLDFPFIQLLRAGNGGDMGEHLFFTGGVFNRLTAFLFFMADGL